MPTNGKRRAGNTGYSLAELLAKQPAAFKRHSSFPQLLEYLNEDAKLRSLMVTRTCTQLLNKGQLSPQQLENAYRTYRLPRHPFFPLFILLRREYLEDQEALKEQRAQSVAAIMKRIPIQIQHLIAFLARLEETQEHGHPLWTAELFPRTKKQANELYNYDLEQWLRFLSAYIDKMIKVYKNMPLADREKLLACMLLECLPDSFLLQWPSDETVKDAFRRLSKKAHPDMGSDGHLFPHLVHARDVLVENRPIMAD